MLHELIDIDNPRCLYCNSDCDFEHDSKDMSMMPPSGHTFEVRVLTCRKCQEVFEIHWYETNQQVTQYYGFVFTCKDILVFNMYLMSPFEGAEGMFCLGKKDKHLHSLIGNRPGAFPYRPRIRPFPVNFSDKEKLYEKLKTYVLFS